MTAEPDTRRSLIARFDQRSAAIGIVGMGYVGLPLAMAYAAARFTVLGFDVDAAKVAHLSCMRAASEWWPRLVAAWVVLPQPEDLGGRTLFASSRYACAV